MNYRGITSLMLRIAGVLILVKLVVAAPQTIANLLLFGGPTSHLLGIIVLLILPFAIGLGLIYFPSTVTNHLIPLENDKDASEISGRLQPVALVSLGVYFVCAALFDGAYWYAKLRLYYSFIAEQPWKISLPHLIPDDFAGIASTAVQLLIGLVLIFGSKGISNVIARLRS